MKHTWQIPPFLNLIAGGYYHINESDPVMSLLSFPPTGTNIEATKHFQGLSVRVRTQLDIPHLKTNIIPTDGVSRKAWACRIKPGPSHQETEQKLPFENEMAQEKVF